MPRVPDLPCAGCGELMWRGTTSLPAGQARCLPCRRGANPQPPKQSTCPVCEKIFNPVRGSRGWSETCSRVCGAEMRVRRGMRPRGRDPERERANWQKKNRARRSKKRGQPSESYTTGQIAERDGYRCGLCRRKVDMTLRRPNLRSASIDHIVPLSKGGDDTRANVQLAHLDCNIKKSNAVEYAQQLLFG